MKKAFWSVVVLGLLSQFGCSSSPVATVSPGVMDDKPVASVTTLSNEEIGAMVQYSYESLRFMKTEVDLAQSIASGDLSKMDVKGGHERTKVVSVAGPDAFKTGVYNVDHPGKTWRDKLVIGFSGYQGSLQEYYPNESVDYNEYPSPYPCGTDNPKGWAPQNCLIGLWTYSWVVATPGQELPQPLNIGEYFRNVLSSSVRNLELEEEARKQGKNYIVFHKGKGTPANEQIMYLSFHKVGSTELLLVDEWDTIDKIGESDAENVTRTRDITYHVLSFDVPTDINWKLWDSNLLLSKK